jgi:hypothetical protein
MTMTAIKSAIQNLLSKQTSITPLVVFRIAFGLMMAASAIRFWAKGWIKPLYIDPEYHFKFYCFEWVEALPGQGMYWLFGALILLSLFIAVGFFYRVSATLYFLLFTYVELIDKALYLNHYYFISLVSFLMIFMPAHRAFSLDVWRRKGFSRTHIPVVFPNIIKLQLALVYIFAGITKINHEWLFEAMPLKLWLPARANLPIIGAFFDYEWMPYLMSWSGMLFDLTIPFFLLLKKTRPWAYVTVVVFHALTWFLFQIGMFPWIMIVSTLIFFSAEDYSRLIGHFSKRQTQQPDNRELKVGFSTFLKMAIVFYFFIQLTLPLRHYFYNGNANWNEQGFRYSWNVMRVEKNGYVEYRCVDEQNGKEWLVYPVEHLTEIQVKQMAFQPDMILQYAHYIRDRYSQKVKVYAQSYVSLNGRPSREFVLSEVNLALEKESLYKPYKFIVE